MSAPTMLAPRRMIAAVVGVACRRSLVVVVGGLLLAVASAIYVVGHFAMTTDTAALIAASTPWRMHEAAFDRAFPGKSDQIVVVVDGRTPELAEAGAAALAERLAERPKLFRGVSRPGAGPYFDREGLLFLPIEETRATVARLLAAQPLVGPLAADPSLRGVMTSLSGALAAVHDGQLPLARLELAMRRMSEVLEAHAGRQPAYLSWSEVIAGALDPRDTRRLIMVEPRLDHALLTPGAAASAAVRGAAADLRLDASHGVRVRLTGSVVLDDEQLATLRDGAGISTAAMLGFVTLMLWLGVRSVRTIVAILTTVAVGLAITTAGGLIAFGRYNVISVAFIALFVGLGVDFAIQFCVRLRAERASTPTLQSALVAAGSRAGAGMALAAAATSVGFLAFAPTRYVGIAQLGVIAGVGMIIAFVLSITFLPALLLRLQPRGVVEAVGFARMAGLDRRLAERRGWLLLGFAALGAAGVALIPALRLDFDPISLDSPTTESVSTLRDLARQPDTTLNTLDVLAPSRVAADAVAARLERLPQVGRVVTLSSFVPTDQTRKLALIADAALLLDPSVNPFDTASPPSDVELVASLKAPAASLRAAASLGAAGASQAARLAADLDRLAAGSAQDRSTAQQALTAGVPTLLGQLRAALTATLSTVESLPSDLRADWRAPGGQVRIKVFPKDAADPRAVTAFVEAVRGVAGDRATGTRIAVRQSGDTILAAFGEAAEMASAVIVLLLAVVLRRPHDVVCALAPVLLTLGLTLGSCGLFGIVLNLENIIALPLILSVGVAFDIYVVIDWRRGDEPQLGSSLTRAILFSALTTAAAFGSLCLSPHPGTSSMGTLLLIALAWTLVTTLVFTPALLGPAPDGDARPRGVVGPRSPRCAAGRTGPSSLV